jgi:eukaryotic-like serine/threonine-protein kinase
MELVKGIPLTQYCDEHRLSILDRLNLFQQICSAAQHAHQKGIIHRDLKPSNILVESHDDKAVPKVIDFGLAKATSGIQLSEHTLFTALGTVAGTPLYMAPEQAKFNAVDVDTRADIYALGVILYELLTGTTPIERETFKKAALDEILRVVREQEPPTPSKRLSSSESKPNVAANRQMEPLKLGRFVRGELDWIVMKALSKERDRRYETANGFAKDIERFLNHEPVLAGPPSARYKLRKFVQRNRPQVIAGSLVLMALVGGVIGTTFGLIRADAARRAESEQRLIAEHKQSEAEAERARAEKAEAETLADYRASTDDAIEQLIGSKPELGSKEKAYLENTLKRWKEFASRKGDDEHSQSIRAQGQFRVARLWQKLGRKHEAVAEFEAALDTYKKLTVQFPAMGLNQSNMAGAHYNLAVLLYSLGKPEDAQAEWRAARDLFERLIEQFPGVASYKSDLAATRNGVGGLYQSLGKFHEAQVEWETARDLQAKLVAQFPDNPEYQKELARTHNNLGVLFGGVGGIGEPDKARAEYEAARDIQKSLVDKFPKVPEYALELSRACVNLGILAAQLGKPEEARREFRAGLDILKKLVDQFPAVPDYRRELGHGHSNLGFLLAGLGKGEEARTEYQAVLDIRERLVKDFPQLPSYQVELGACQSNFGVMLRAEGKPAESLKWFDLAIQTLEPIYKNQPRDVTVIRFLFNSHFERAQAYDQLRKSAEAAKDWDRAIELSPPAERPGLRASRATSRLQAGMVAEAVAEVTELTKSEKWNAAEWYDFACFYAVASGKIADKKQEYADRAMELLQQAVKAGYKDAAHMTKDTDLDPLRGREDFKKLMAELEKKK